MSELRHSPGKMAFTLVELMAVIVIIGILLAMILGLGAYAKRMANEARAKTDLERLMTAAQDYKIKYGSFPDIGVGPRNTTLFLSVSPANAITNLLPEGFNFRDPWQRPYLYIRSSRYSAGFHSMGFDGTNDTADDIYSGR